MSGDFFDGANKNVAGNDGLAGTKKRGVGEGDGGVIRGGDEGGGEDSKVFRGIAAVGGQFFFQGSVFLGDDQKLAILKFQML